MAVFDSLNAHFAANASAWDAVRNASATPWFIPRIVSGTDANRLVDQAASQDIQRIWGHASANLWSVRHFWTLAKQAQANALANQAKQARVNEESDGAGNQELPRVVAKPETRERAWDNLASWAASHCASIKP